MKKSMKDKEDNCDDNDNILSERMMKLKIESNERIRMKELEIEKELRELEIQSKERIKIEELRVIKSKEDEQYMKDFAKVVMQEIKSETFIKKHTSQLSTQWYRQVLSFSTIVSPSVEESDEFEQFVRDFKDTFDSFLNELESAYNRSERYVQSSLGPLMDKIFEIFFNYTHCEVSLNSRDVITVFEDIVDNDALKFFFAKFQVNLTVAYSGDH